MGYLQNKRYWSLCHCPSETHIEMPVTDASSKRDWDGNGAEDRALPSDLVSSCKQAWRRHKNPNFLVPILGSLSSQEVLSLLPQFIPLETARLQQAFDRLMRKRPGTLFYMHAGTDGM